MNDENQPTNAGSEEGNIAFQIASSTLAGIRALKEKAQMTLALLRSIANMTVLPEGELLVGDGRSLLTLPEVQPAQRFFAASENIQVSVEATMTELLGVLVGFEEYCPASNPPKTYLNYASGGAGGVEAASVFGPAVTWGATGPAFVCSISTGVISNATPIPQYDASGTISGTVHYTSDFNPTGSGACSTAPVWTSAYNGNFSGTITSGTGATVGGAGVSLGVPWSVSFTVTLSNLDTDANAITYAATRAAYGYNPNYSATGDSTNAYGFPSAGPGNAGIATNYESRVGSGVTSSAGLQFWYQFGTYHLHFTGIIIIGRTVNWSVLWESRDSFSDDNSYTRYGAWSDAHTDSGSFVTSGSTHDTPDIACPGADGVTVGLGFGKQYRIKAITVT